MDNVEIVNTTNENELTNQEPQATQQEIASIITAEPASSEVAEVSSEPFVSEQPENSVVPESPVAEIKEGVDTTVPVEVAANSEAIDTENVEVSIEEDLAKLKDVVIETELEEVDKKSARHQHFENVYQQLKLAKENNESIEVFVKSRIKGGLRVIYKEMPLFLPASHFSMKRIPLEQDLREVCGKTIDVTIHELEEKEEGRKTVIVSRKQHLLKNTWEILNIGDLVEGKVSSVTSFGVFVDIGGVEGLIHISRLSQIRTEDPTKLFKRGDTIRAVVVELDKERGRIGLSRKETEESPWNNIEQEFPIGSIHSAKVRRFTDFGAYLELRTGIDGLLRTGEMSWTKRIRKPSELFKVGDSLDVSILSISEEKRSISLSLKRTQPNPWKEIAEKYAVGKEFEGKVSFIMQKGAIVTLNDELDGFMPRSKMKNIGSGNRIPYQTGDVIAVTIADIVPDEESLILAPVYDKAASNPSYNNQDRNQRRNNKPTSTIPQADKAKGNESGTFTFGDMLSEQMKDSLVIQP